MGTASVGVGLSIMRSKVTLPSKTFTSPKIVVMLEGEIPSALNPPSGCRFHPRCPHAMPRCADEAPIGREIAPQHTVACHLY